MHSLKPLPRPPTHLLPPIAPAPAPADRTFVADRMVGLASMPMSYLLQMASAAGGSQTQPGAISAGLPGVNVPQSTATGMAGTQGVVQEQQGRLLLT